LCIKLEIKQGYTTMHGQPLIKTEILPETSVNKQKPAQSNIVEDSRSHFNSFVLESTSINVAQCTTLLGISNSIAVLAKFNGHIQGFRRFAAFLSIHNTQIARYFLFDATKRPQLMINKLRVK